MAAKLSDAEFIERARASARQRAERQRERRLSAGRVALTVWLTQPLKAALTAAAHGATLNETAERLLSAGLNATTTATPAAKPPVYTVVGDAERAALMTEIGELLEQGFTGADVARQLNASGQRTASGAEFSGGNLLRDYRAWVKKTNKSGK